MKAFYMKINDSDTLHMFKTKNYDIHITNFENGDHFCASLYDLIPKEIKNIYLKYYAKLIIGFIRENEQNKLIPNIPFVIKKLLLTYFPCFL